MDKQLRVIAGEIIVMSEMSKQAKMQLLNFVKEEASDAQVKALLMDGRIVELDKYAEEIVNDRFEVSEAGGRVAKLRKTVHSVGAGTTALGIPYVIYRKIRSVHDACTKKCGTYEFNTSRRQHCMLKCKSVRDKARYDAIQKTGDPNAIAKAKLKVVKNEEALRRSIKSFKDRGTSSDA